MPCMIFFWIKGSSLNDQSFYETAEYKNDHCNFSELKVTSLNVWFSPNNSPKPKDTQFIVGKKAANPHIWEAGIKESLAFLLDEWLTNYQNCEWLIFGCPINQSINK